MADYSWRRQCAATASPEDPPSRCVRELGHDGLHKVALSNGALWQFKASDTPPALLAGREFPTVWVHYSPDLLMQGVNCELTPRRTCKCTPQGSHDHLISAMWREKTGASSSDPRVNGVSLSSPPSERRERKDDGPM